MQKIAGNSSIHHLLFFVLFIISSGCSHAEPCYSCPEYIEQKIYYEKKYPFIRYHYNIFQWSDYKAIEPMVQSMKNVGSRKLKVIHFGDSHVQADIFTHEIRTRLQKVFGEGGRGMVFPYSAARTHPGSDYTTTFTGLWESAKNVQFQPKLDIGISGVTIKTFDKKATFTIRFAPNPQHANNKILKIYRKYSENSYDLKILPGGVQQSAVYVNTKLNPDKPFVEVELPKASDNLTFYIYQSEKNQTFFECHGISFETPENQGILYHSVGINGAGFLSILRQNLMDQQIADMQPDILVIDLGGNDYYAGINEPMYEYNLRAIINRFKNAAPNSTIIISCSHDLYRGGLSIPEVGKAQAIAKRVAFDTQSVFFDYYNVSGGRYSMLEWHKNNLCQWDRVHLNFPGYKLRGELYANAYLNTYHQILLNGIFDKSDLSLVVLNKEEPKKIPTALVENTHSHKKEEVKIVKKVPVKAWHRVNKGEYLSMIADKYEVTVTDIQKWNFIRGNTIYAGQYLTIYTDSSLVPKNQIIQKIVSHLPKTQQTHISNHTKNSSLQVQNKQIASNLTTQNNITKPLNSKNQTSKKYTVKSGDNLWLIAKKHNVSVEKLLKINPGKDKKLMPGDILNLP